MSTFQVTYTKPTFQSSHVEIQYDLQGLDTIVCVPCYQQVNQFESAIPNVPLLETESWTLSGSSLAIPTQHNVEWRLHTLRFQTTMESVEVRIYYDSDLLEGMEYLYDYLSNVQVTANPNGTFDPYLLSFQVQVEKLFTQWYPTYAWYLQEALELQITSETQMGVVSTTTNVDRTLWACSNINCNSHLEVVLSLNSSTAYNLTPYLAMKLTNVYSSFYFPGRDHILGIYFPRLERFSMFTPDPNFQHMKDANTIQYRCYLKKVDRFFQPEKEWIVTPWSSNFANFVTDLKQLAPDDAFPVYIQLSSGQTLSPLLQLRCKAGHLTEPIVSYLIQKYLSVSPNRQHIEFRAMESIQYFFNCLKEILAMADPITHFKLELLTENNTVLTSRDCSFDELNFIWDIPDIQWYDIRLSLMETASRSYVQGNWLSPLYKEYAAYTFVMDSFSFPTALPFDQPTLMATTTISNDTYIVPVYANVLSNSWEPQEPVSGQPIVPTSLPLQIPTRNESNFFLKELHFYVPNHQLVKIPIHYQVPSSHLQQMETRPSIVTGMINTEPMTQQKQLLLEKSMLQRYLQQHFWLWSPGTIRVAVQYEDALGSSKVSDLDLASELERYSFLDMESNPMLIVQLGGKILLVSLMEEYIMTRFHLSLNYNGLWLFLDEYCYPQFWDWMFAKYTDITLLAMYSKLNFNGQIVSSEEMRDRLIPYNETNPPIPATLGDYYWLSCVHYQRGTFQYRIPIYNQILANRVGFQKYVNQYALFELDVPHFYKTVREVILWGLQPWRFKYYPFVVTTSTNQSVTIPWETPNVVSLPLTPEDTSFTVKFSLPDVTYGGTRDISTVQQFQIDTMLDPIEYDLYSVVDTPQVVLSWKQPCTVPVVTNHQLLVFPKYTNHAYGTVQVLPAGTYVDSTQLPIPYMADNTRLVSLEFQFARQDVPPPTSPTSHCTTIPVIYHALETLASDVPQLVKQHAWCSSDGTTLFWDWKQTVQPLLVTIEQVRVDNVLVETEDVFEYKTDKSSVDVQVHISKSYWQHVEILHATLFKTSLRAWLEEHPVVLEYVVGVDSTIVLPSELQDVFGRLEIVPMYTTLESSSAWIEGIPTSSTIPTSQNHLVLAKVQIDNMVEIPIFFVPERQQLQQLLDTSTNLVFEDAEHWYLDVQNLYRLIQQVYWNTSISIQIDEQQQLSSPLLVLVKPLSSIQLVVHMTRRELVHTFSLKMLASTDSFPSTSFDPIFFDQSPTYTFSFTSNRFSIQRLVLPRYVETDHNGWNPGTTVDRMDLMQVENNSSVVLPTVLNHSSGKQLLSQLVVALSTSTHWDDVFLTKTYSVTTLPSSTFQTKTIQTQLQEIMTVKEQRVSLNMDTLLPQISSSWSLQLRTYSLWNVHFQTKQRTLVKEWLYEQTASAPTDTSNSSSTPIPLETTNPLEWYSLLLFEFTQTVEVEVPVFDYTNILQQWLLTLPQMVYRMNSDSTIQLPPFPIPLLSEQVQVFPVYRYMELEQSYPVFKPIPTLLEHGWLTQLKVGFPNSDKVSIPIYNYPRAEIVEQRFRVSLELEPLKLIIGKQSLFEEYFRFYWNLPPQSKTRAWFVYNGKSIPIDMERVEIELDTTVVQTKIRFETDGVVVHIPYIIPNPVKELQTISKTCVLQKQGEMVRIVSKKLSNFKWHATPFYKNQALDSRPLEGVTSFPFQDRFGNVLSFVEIGAKKFSISAQIGWPDSWSKCLFPKQVQHHLTSEVFRVGQPIVLEHFPWSQSEAQKAKSVLRLQAPGELDSSYPYYTLEVREYYTIITLFSFHSSFRVPIFHFVCKGETPLTPFEGILLSDKSVYINNPLLPDVFETELLVSQKRKLKGKFVKVRERPIYIKQ